MGLNIFKNISSTAKKVASGVTGFLKSPVIASVASFIPGGSALISTVTAVSSTVDKAIPSENVVAKKAAGVVVASGSPGTVGSNTSVTWKEKYIEDTKKVGNNG
jgi:hypothetical protein